MSLGQNIKNLRLHYGLLQKDIAVIAGVSNRTVLAWEKGRIEPRMGSIQKLVDHFGIKKSDIIEPSETNEFYMIVEVNSEEKELLTSYRALSSEGKKFLKGMIGQISNFTAATM